MRHHRHLTSNQRNYQALAGRVEATKKLADDLRAIASAWPDLNDALAVPHPAEPGNSRSLNSSRGINLNEQASAAIREVEKFAKAIAQLFRANPPESSNPAEILKFAAGRASAIVGTTEITDYADKLRRRVIATAYPIPPALQLDYPCDYPLNLDEQACDGNWTMRSTSKGNFPTFICSANWNHRKRSSDYLRTVVIREQERTLVHA